MRPTTTWRGEEGVNGCVREGRRGLWGAAMRRRPRPRFFTEPVRDVLNAIGVFILLAVVLQILNSLGLQP